MRRYTSQRSVGPDGVVIGDVLSQDPALVALVEDEDVVETLAADRANEALHDGVGLRSAVRRADRLNAVPWSRPLNAPPNHAPRSRIWKRGCVCEHRACTGPASHMALVQL